LVIASSEERNCESDFDVPIPEFGAAAKSREQLQRERDDADRIARARVQLEAAEQARREEELRKDADAKARREAELMRLSREKIVSSLDNIRIDWRDIQGYLGFKYFVTYVAKKNLSSLEEASSSEEAIKLLAEYIKWASMNSSVDVGLVDKSLLVNGRLVISGKVSQVNTGLRFFVVDFSDEKYVWGDVVISHNDKSFFGVFKPSRVSGLRSSFILREPTTPLNVGAIVYSVKN